MSDTPHTPGPWTVDSDPMGEDIYVETADKALLAVVPQNEANARLIAAAPDLLAFVRMIADSAMFGDPENYRHEAKALLAKVEGREP